MGLAWLVGAGLVAPRLRAHFQTPAVVPIAFDVVSIKPAVPPPTSPGGIPLALAGSFYVSGGRFRAPAATAKALISAAFGMKVSRIVGGPDWMETSQFEITATTVDRDVTQATLNAQLPELLRGVLDDRFSLEAHVERRVAPVYVLVKARGDGRLGARLRPSVTDCRAVGCKQGNGTLLTRDATMTRLADLLTSYVDRPVLDRTDLTGTFDVDLEWAPGTRIGSGINAPIDTLTVVDGSSLFTAIPEQLGLKLERRNEPIDLVVVGHIERPTPN